MKSLLFSILLFPLIAGAATPFTEFYCNFTGTNINAGTTTNAVPVFSDANGNWDATTGIFICSGAFDLSAVAVGMWASVFVDGATTAVFVGRITAVVDATDTITVSVVIKTGTPPSTSATGRSIRIGGAWYGPWYTGGTVDNLPFSFVNNLLTNTSLHSTRINLKNDRIYATTNLVQASNGPIYFSGYATNAGDLGMPEITGSAVGAGHAMFTASGANVHYSDLIFATNGTTGQNSLFTLNAAENVFRRCVFRDSRGTGFAGGGFATSVRECEAFRCNANNTVALGGFSSGGPGAIFTRCISHDNTGVGNSGFVISARVILDNCISDSNGRDGAYVDSVAGVIIQSSDFYNNGTNGVHLLAASAIDVAIENCNFIGNGVGLTGAYAINSTGSLLRNGSVVNCAFGTGTATNGSGGANIFPGTALDEVGSIGYAVNAVPWVDPANGDFRINLAASINAGRGNFTQTAASYAGAVGYPDIGAAQTTNAAGGSSSVAAYPIFRR